MTGTRYHEENENENENHKQSERPRFLRLVDGKGSETTAYMTANGGDAEPAPEPAQAHDASTIIGNAVMYAAMSWVACCQEKQGVSVSVAQVGGGLFDAEVTTADGRSTFLRVRLILERGPRLTAAVEPVHP